MIELNSIFSSILKLTAADFEKAGFAPMDSDDSGSLYFKGEGGRLKIAFTENKIVLSHSAENEDFKELSVSLLDLNTADENDIKYISGEISDSVIEKFAKIKTAGSGKVPGVISRSQARSGALAYDINTLASRLSTSFPELKEPYKENVSKYGELLSEDFFRNHANKLILSIIKSKDKQKLKKLFTVLNDIYENGSNETQSLIAVTVLGEMNNEPELIETAKEYMSDTMAPYVIRINKIFTSSSGKAVKKKLLNPPPYKPKKEKKPSLLSNLSGM